MSQVALEPPPHSLDAERAVLGALLLDPFEMTNVAAVLTPEDFYDPIYGTIYYAIRKLYEDRTPIDFVTVTEALRGHPKIERLGGSAFLADLVTDVPTAAHAKHYAEIVQGKSLRRELSRVGTAIAKSATLDEKKSASELMEMAEQELLKLSKRSTDAKPVLLKQLVSERYDFYVEAHEAPGIEPRGGINIGFADIDYLLQGLEPGHLMILAGRPSMGKTALAGNIAFNVARGGKTVALFSLEMSDKQITDRIVANLLAVEPSKLKRGTLTDEQFAELGKGIDRLDSVPLYIDECRDPTLATLRSKARWQQIENGLDLLIVDYLQIIDLPDRKASENQTQRITHISRSLKNLARELGIPVIALCQLSRACEHRTPPIPILSDLRDSGAIEQDADSVLMLYREGEYNVDCEDPKLTEVYVRKNRDGATGRADLIFHKEKLSFLSVDRHH